jgi:hypothetical protein
MGSLAEKRAPTGAFFLSEPKRDNCLSRDEEPKTLSKWAVFLIVKV